MLIFIDLIDMFQSGNWRSGIPVPENGLSTSPVPGCAALLESIA
jgi:hypothetical protein